MADSATDRTVLTIVDRIYEAVERPERWPETIRDLGDIVGGRRDFWDLNQSSRPGCLASSQAALDEYHQVAGAVAEVIGTQNQ